jgi:hypothetical protein
MEAYETQVSARARHYELGLGFIHILGAVALPGSIREPMVAPGETAYWKWRETHNPPEGASFEEWKAWADAELNPYLRAHPAAWPYAVYSRERVSGEFGLPGYTDRSLNPDDFFDKALGQMAYWREDEPPPEVDITKDPVAFSSLSPRRKSRRVAEWTVTPVGELTDVQADAVGLPRFEGRDRLLSNVDAIMKQYERDYEYDMSDEQKALVAAHRDYLLEKETQKYGPEGLQVLSYIRATPGQRLNRSGYFTGPQMEVALTEAQSITRHAIATGYSPQGASTTTGVLQKKVDLYKRIDNLRKLYPALDRQLRYAELGLGDKDGPAGRVATYEYLFFNSEANDFGYQDAIVEAMEGH